MHDDDTVLTYEDGPVDPVRDLHIVNQEILMMVQYAIFCTYMCVYVCMYCMYIHVWQYVYIYYVCMYVCMYVLLEDLSKHMYLKYR